MSLLQTFQKTKLRTVLLLLSGFLLGQTNLHGALPRDSSILTATGTSTPIQELELGQTVISYEDGTLCRTSTKAIRKTVVDDIVIILTRQGIVRVSADQRLYEPQKHVWLPAAELTEEHVLLTSELEHCRCLQVKRTKLHKPIDSFDIALAEPHTFFFSKARLLTHNFLPIAIGASIAFDTVLSGVAVSGVGISVAGGLLSIKKLFSSPNIPGSSPETPGIWPGSPMPDPEDDDGKPKFRFTEESFKKAFDTVVQNENDMHHYFGHEKHKLKPLVKELHHSPEYVIHEILKNIDGQIPASEGVINETVVNIRGRTIHIRSTIVNGIPRIGTIFIP